MVFGDSAAVINSCVQPLCRKEKISNTMPLTSGSANLADKSFKQELGAN